jgi:hypothetical protein
MDIHYRKDEGCYAYISHGKVLKQGVTRIWHRWGLHLKQKPYSRNAPLCRPYLLHKVPCFLGDIINVLTNYTQEIPLSTKYLQIIVKFKIQLNNNPTFCQNLRNFKLFQIWKKLCISHLWWEPNTITKVAIGNEKVVFTFLPWTQN